MMSRTIINKLVYICLLYFANQLGRKMSKLSFEEFEYFLASNVTGHRFLNISRTTPSSITSPIPIQTHLSILFVKAA
jgi:hypothetical protein